MVTAIVPSGPAPVHQRPFGRPELTRMAKAPPPAKLQCPCCGKPRPVAGTTLLRAEAEWLATGASDARRPPGWSVEAAREGRLQWACSHCIRAGLALEGHPALQTWCDYNP